jgi:hypothetical protein
MAIGSSPCPVEVNRPDRQARRRHGKSDPVDAEAAARTNQAGEATMVPKAGDGVVEMLRCLRMARATAVKVRTQASNAIKALLITAPADLREQLWALPTAKLVRTAAAFPLGKPARPTAATILALRLLAVRRQALAACPGSLRPDGELQRLTTKAAPRLRAADVPGREKAMLLSDGLPSHRSTAMRDCDPHPAGPGWWSSGCPPTPPSSTRSKGLRSSLKAVELDSWPRRHWAR